jgi:thiamine biosynthesis lipoprotein
MGRVAVPLELSQPVLGPRGGAMVEFGGPTMGVAWSVKAFAPSSFDLSAAKDQIQGLLNRLVAQMSPWEPQSDISRFNRAPAGAWLDMPPAFHHVLTRALAWAQVSDGAFDPTAGRLVDLWGFGPAGAVEAPPTAEAVSAALGASGWDKLALEGSRAFQRGGLELDFSGIAKGFGVDEVSRALGVIGLPNHLVEIGGELRGQGLKPSGEPWWVEIALPPDAVMPEGPILLALHGLSVATSGDYRRFLEYDGQRYAHTLDPRLGRPIDNGVRSVSVVHHSCMEADALSTVLGVLGPQAGPEFAVKHGLAAHFVVDDTAGLREILSPTLQAMLG